MGKNDFLFSQHFVGFFETHCSKTTQCAVNVAVYYIIKYIYNWHTYNWQKVNTTIECEKNQQCLF